MGCWVLRVLGLLLTTPTDGLVERYNQTLKGMLRKFVAANGKDWDHWLPYLMFAYREVPQASTGFSPFELLFGRPVKGPPDLLRDAWESPKPTTTNILTYVITMREKMEEMTTLVKDNLQQAQRTQTNWYDQRTRQRTFQPGQKNVGQVAGTLQHQQEAGAHHLRAGNAREEKAAAGISH